VQAQSSVIIFSLFGIFGVIKYKKQHVFLIKYVLLFLRNMNDKLLYRILHMFKVLCFSNFSTIKANLLKAKVFSISTEFKPSTSFTLNRVFSVKSKI